MSISCPHCGILYHESASQPEIIPLGHDADGTWQIVRQICASCKKIALYLQRGESEWEVDGPYYVYDDAGNIVDTDYEGIYMGMKEVLESSLIRPKQINSISELDILSKSNLLNQHKTFHPPLVDPQYETDIFMVMPFLEEMQTIYDIHIKSVARNLKLQIKRGDDFFAQHAIMEEIWSATNAAKLIIADCTGKNANVFYELGIAHTLDKPTIMITQNREDIPFDVHHRRGIVYHNNPTGMRKFKKELRTAIIKILGLQVEA